MIGNTLSHSEITTEIGKGGMSEVYCDDDNILDRKLALKYLADMFMGDPERMRDP